MAAMTAREKLIEKIMYEGCDGHGPPDGDDYESHHSDDCPDGNNCAGCECWSHVADRALREMDAQ